MSDTRYRSRLPKSCASQLHSFLDWLIFWQRSEPSEWIARPQRKMAAELGVTLRSVQRWERALADLGVIQVQRRQRGNRRTLRLRSWRELSAVPISGTSRTLREWRHACRNSSDTRVATVAAGVTHARASQPNSTLELTPHPPTARKSNGSGVGRERNLGGGLGPALARAVGELSLNLGVWHKRRAELLQIAQALQEALGERAAVETLGWARTKVRGGGTTSSEGARVLGLLQSRLRHVEERNAPRAGALQRA